MAKSQKQNLPAPVVEPEESKALAPVSGAYEMADLGGGFEEMSREDFLIPFLGIYQKMHPQVDESDPAYVEGAKPGLIFNSVTGDMFDGKAGVTIIPVHREHKFIEWIPRDQGGGFVGMHDPTSPEVQAAKAESTDFGKLAIGDGNDLRETFTVYGLQVDDEGSFQYVVISFASTNIKPYKAWMTKALSVQVQTDHGRQTAPLWAHRYVLKARFMENNKGTWHGWDASFLGGNSRAAMVPADSYLYAEAKRFRDMVTSGAARPDIANITNDAAGEAPGDSDEF